MKLLCRYWRESIDVAVDFEHPAGYVWSWCHWLSFISCWISLKIAVGYLQQCLILISLEGVLWWCSKASNGLLNFDNLGYLLFGMLWMLCLIVLVLFKFKPWKRTICPYGVTSNNEAWRKNGEVTLYLEKRYSVS